MASFLDSLVRGGIITSDVAKQVNTTKQQNPTDQRSVIDLLHEDFGIAKSVLQYQVAQFYAFRIIDPGEYSTRRLEGPEILKLLRSLPESVRAQAMRHKVLPMMMAENQPDKLIVVTPNPSDRESAEVARSFTFKKFEVCFMKEQDWDELWKQCSTEKSHRSPTAILDIITHADEVDLDVVLDREIARGQLLSVVDNILAEGIKSGATAVHFTPRTSRKMELLFRIDGHVASRRYIDDVRVEALATAVKMRFSGMDRYDRLGIQEGLAAKTVDGNLVTLHAASIPIDLQERSGKFENIVVRFDQGPNDRTTLQHLGLNAITLATFRQVLQGRRGLMVICGAEGSGKRKTVGAILKEFANASVSILVLEEGMKYAFGSVVHIRRTVKTPLEEVLHRLNAYDPDVVVIDDIRSPEQAHVALQLSVRGKLVIATLCAQNVASGLRRMQVWTEDVALLAQTVRLIHAQRFVGTLCPRCRKEATIDDEITRASLAQSSGKVFRTAGCQECTDGYSGRILLHETLRGEPSLESVFMRIGSSFHQEVSALMTRQHLPTFAEEVRALVLEGKVNVDELVGLL